MVSAVRFAAALGACSVAGAGAAAAADAYPVARGDSLRVLEASELRRSLFNAQQRSLASASAPQQYLSTDIDIDRDATVNVSQVHLALGSTPDTMAVSWMCDAPSLVRFGITGSSGSLENVAEPQVSAPYTMVTMPIRSSSWENYTSGVIHHAYLTGLAPRTRYSYQIVPGPSNSSAPVANPSKVMSFVTPSAIGDTAPMVFDVIGDLGQTNDSVSTMAHIVEDVVNGSEFILHSGDMSYADCLNTRWDSYFDLIEPLASTLPWMVSAGNHEVEPNNLTGRIMDPYKARYAMPQVAPTVDTTQYYQNASDTGFDCCPSAFTGEYDFGNSFYSFRAGMVHFIVLNSYTRTDNTSNQFKWLAQELTSKVDRSITPWVVAMWHSPWYNSNKAHQSEFNTVNMRASMEKLLVDNKVAVVFNGHVHAYERSVPVAFNATTAKAPTYIVIGDGGNREGHADPYSSTAPSWSAYRNASDFGHGRVRVQNATHMQWEWHINHADEWLVSDAATILNPFTGPPAPPVSNCNATDIVTHHSGPPASCAYRNTATNHMTVGYGFDIETQLGHDAIAHLGLNYNEVFFGHTCLNTSSIDFLLQVQLQVAAFQATTAVGPHYATVCCTVANALVDIAYNTSSVTPQHPFRNFTGLIANVLTHNYTAAAESLSASDWCAKSPVACADDVKAVATGCPNATSSFSR